MQSKDLENHIEFLLSAALQKCGNIEQVVTLELRRLSKCLCDDEESFAALLASKTNADILKEKKHIEGELQGCCRRVCSECVTGITKRAG